MLNDMMGTELKIFLALLRAGILGEEPDLAPFAEQWDQIRPEAVCDLALRHDVVLAVYAALDGAKEPKLVRVKKGLRPLYGPRFAKSVNQDAEGAVMLDAFEAAGIDCIPLKGWTLRQLYADPLSRSMNDLDILIRNYEHRRMLRLMEGLGYEGESLSGWKHQNYKKKPYMNVELHRRLTDDTGAVRQWEERMWSRCRPMEGYAHVFQMAEEDFLLHHLLHMREDLSHGTLGFRRIADTWLLLRTWTDLDRDYLDPELQALGLQPFFGRIQRLCAVCFEGEEPDAETRILFDHAAENSISGAEKTYQVSRMAMMSDGDVGAARLKSLWNAVFLPYARMKAQYPIVERYPVLLPICWILRLGRFAKFPKRNLKKLRSDGVTQEELERMRRVLRAGGILPESDGEGGEA